jgi:hypothetical protein
MGNRERIARAADEARAAAAERSAKRAAKPTAGVRQKSESMAPRMKIEWDVCGSTGTKYKSFPYAEKAAAEAAAMELTRSTGRAHYVRESRVAM